MKIEKRKLLHLRSIRSFASNEIARTVIREMFLNHGERVTNDKSAWGVEPASQWKRARRTDEHVD